MEFTDVVVPLRAQVFGSCGSSDLAVRVYSFQTLEQLLDLCKHLVTEQGPVFARQLAGSMITHTIELVLANWEHSSKHISNLMGPLFETVFTLKVRAPSTPPLSS